MSSPETTPAEYPAPPPTTVVAPAVVPPIPRPLKSPGVAMLLSLLMPGLGQFYNGHLSKAIFFFFAFTGSIYLIVESQPLPFAFFLPFIMFSNMIDASLQRTLINARRAHGATVEEDDVVAAGLGHRPRRGGPAPLPEQHGLAPSVHPRSLLAAAPHRRRRRAPAAVHAAQGRQWHVRLSPRCWCWASR